MLKKQETPMIMGAKYKIKKTEQIGELCYANSLNGKIDLRIQKEVRINCNIDDVIL